MVAALVTVAGMFSLKLHWKGTWASKHRFKLFSKWKNAMTLFWWRFSVTYLWWRH